MKNTTQEFREKCTRVPEAVYGKLMKAHGKIDNQRPRLPKEANKTGGHQFSLEPFHRVVAALKGGPLLTREVAKALGYSPRSSQTTNMLRRLMAIGVVERTDTQARGVEPHWWLSGRELVEADADLLQGKKGAEE